MNTKPCPYCGRPKPDRGWHSCAQAQAARTKIGHLIESLYEMAHYGRENWDDDLASRTRLNATALTMRVQGVQTKERY